MGPLREECDEKHPEGREEEGGRAVVGVVVVLMKLLLPPQPQPLPLAWALRPRRERRRVPYPLPPRQWMRVWCRMLPVAQEEEVLVLRGRRLRATERGR